MFSRFFKYVSPFACFFLIFAQIIDILMTITIKLWSLMTAAVMALCLTACSEKSDNEEPVSPTPQVPTGDWQTVPASGGTIEKGDISITFPSGTFTAETKVAVTEVKKGDIRGDDEVSPFYQVTMPAVTRQKMTVSIKSDATDDDIIMVAHGLASSLSGETCYVDMPLDATHRNGVYTAELPVFDNNADASYMGTITFGLTHAASAPTTAKAHSTETRSKDNGTFVFNFDWGNRYVAMENKELQDEMEGYLYEAVRLINGLGIKVQEDRKVPIIIEKDKTHGGSHLNDGEHGRYVIGQWSRKHGYILINDGFRTQEEPNKYDKETLRKTIIHELFHYFQTDYDPRDDFWKGGYFWGDTNSDYLMLYESGGVWIEKLMANEGNFSSTFISNMDRAPTVMRGLCNVVDGNSQSLGYGQAIFLEYMTKQKGNEAVKILLETWKENNGKEALDIYKAWAKAIDVDIFTLSVGMDEFYKFLVDVSIREVVSVFSFPNILPVQGSGFNDDVKKVQADGTVNYQGKVYPYGGHFAIYGLVRYRNENGENSFKGKQLTFTETQKSVRTYVFYRTQDGFIQLGKFWESEPLIITDEALLQTLNSATDMITRPLYMLTYSDDNAKTYSSEITVTLGEATPTLSLGRQEINFNAIGGTDTISVDTNQETVRVSTTATWLDATYDAEKKEISIEAKQNDKTEEREAYVTIQAQNSAGNVEKTVHVTQMGKSVILWHKNYKGAYVTMKLKGRQDHYLGYCPYTMAGNETFWAEAGCEVTDSTTKVVVKGEKGPIWRGGKEARQETWDMEFVIDNTRNTLSGTLHQNFILTVCWTNAGNLDDPMSRQSFTTDLQIQKIPYASTSSVGNYDSWSGTGVMASADIFALNTNASEEFSGRANGIINYTSLSTGTDEFSISSADIEELRIFLVIGTTEQ